MIWDTAERLVNRSTLIENNEDAKKIMRAPSKHKSLHRLKSMDGQLCPSCAMIRKQSMESNNGSALSNGTPGLSLPPPPPPRVLESARSARSKLRGARPSMRAPSTTIWRCSFSSAMSRSSGQQPERKRNYLYELASIMFTHSSAYPLAGLCALLNNLIEIRR